MYTGEGAWGGYLIMVNPVLWPEDFAAALDDECRREMEPGWFSRNMLQRSVPEPERLHNGARDWSEGGRSKSYPRRKPRDPEIPHAVQIVYDGITPEEYSYRQNRQNRQSKRKR